MSNVESKDTLIVDGVMFNVEIVTNEGSLVPWKMSDGHGPVRQISRNPAIPKRPGERYLSERGVSSAYLYDWQAAITIALRDHWGPGERAASHGLTPHQVAAVAVQADFEYLRAWCNDEWHYVGIVVTHEASGAHRELWGIESNAGDEYLNSVTHDLARECMDAPEYMELIAYQAACFRALAVASQLDTIRALTNENCPATISALTEAAELLRTLAKRGSNE